MIEIFHFGLIRYFNNNNQQHRANGLPSTIWSDGVGCEYRVVQQTVQGYVQGKYRYNVFIEKH